MNKREVYSHLEIDYRKNYSNYVGRLTKRFQSKAKAEDVVQEAYTRAFTYWETCPTPGEIVSWFSMILSNCIKDAKKDDRMRGMSVEDSEAEDVPTPCNGFHTVELNQVTNAINAKPKAVAYILGLNLLQQLRPREIAQLVPETEAAIRQIVHRFRLELKELFP